VALPAVAVFQMLPLPASIADLISPHAAPVRAALALDPNASFDWQPLTIARRSTAWAALVTTGVLALFFSARRVLSHGGVRRTARGICALGLLFSAIAIAQAASAGRRIYWRFPTEYEGPLPFGPFVNRNHFATWMIMAVPLCLGYIAARVRASSSAPTPQVTRRVRIARMADGRGIWLTAAALTMAAALLTSLSRSGILSLLAAIGIAGMATAGRIEGRRRLLLLAVTGTMIAAGAVAADVPALAQRFGQSASGVHGRVMIWRDTLPVLRDFWLTGTGEGTFRTSMFYYQRAYRDVQFNQAHNHYLQAAAEGGLLLLVPLGCALFFLARIVRIRLAADEDAGMYWIRTGAVTGLVAVGLQSFWETGLVMPANAALAAVLAAIAVHRRDSGRPER
jgi:O-antigen ligase